MSTATTTTNKSSPRLCLLLKTLLFLLCIYIKRITAAQLLPTSLGANVDEPLTFDDKMVTEGEVDFDLQCPVDVLVRPKAAAAKNVDKSFLKELRDSVMESIDVIWLKNDDSLHRENGNPYLKQLETDEDVGSLKLLLVSLTDGGRYTCLLNYTLVPGQAYDYFNLYPSASFNLLIQPTSERPPDQKPTISHPPANLIAKRGDNATFTCNRIDTLSHQTTHWFRSCPLTNHTCPEEFLNDYRSATAGKKAYIYRYIISNENKDEFSLFNVSESDVRYYGCLVENNLGFDIRLGSLQLLDMLLQSEGISQNTLAANAHALSPTKVQNQTLPANETVRQPAISTTLSEHKNVSKPADLFHGANVAAVSQDDISFSKLGVLLSACILFAIFTSVFSKILSIPCKRKNKSQNILIVPDATIGVGTLGHGKANMRQHLPNGDCPDIYNIGKTADGFISGHLHQENGHLMSQSICSQMLEKEKNLSISSNSNSDEASSWGKSMSSHGDNSRAFYLHTSNTTTTTVPMYDHPPSTGTAQLCGAIVQDACVINPTYGFLRPDSDATNWAFPRRNLERLNKIGEGQFGEVWRCIARQKDGNEIYVAVKQLKNRAGLGDRERLELIAEIEIMKLVNNHPNVIKLLNYCADNYEPILLIMEYAEHGKLQTYLRNCRSFRKSYGCIGDFSTVITSKELIKFSYHIAKGMEYVAAQGIIHRDLASRNILVSKDKVCKVADFGFARRVHDECAYERSSANPVPVKWMAPEALVENKFTTKSDVFSLGILMWEIVTLGATPYEYLNSSEVYRKVTSGGRLDKPTHCRDEFYDIMTKCWLHDPKQRPTFKELAYELEKLLHSEVDYIELDQYPEHAYYNILNAEEEKEIVHNIVS